MNKLIKIVLIGLLVLSNISISPAFAKESSETSTKEKVNLYLPEFNKDLVLYKDKELKEELTQFKNNSSALLLEEIDAVNSSLVEVETIEKETLKGYINSEAVVKEAGVMKEYKLYAEKVDEKISIYIDKTLEETLYEIEDSTSILVNEEDLKKSNGKDYVYISLNPKIEEVPDELKEEIEKVEDIQGFVNIDRLVDLEDEEKFLVEREAENQISEESVEEETDEVENETSEESKPVVEDEITEENSEELEEDQNEQQAEESEEMEEKEEITKERNTFSMMRSSMKETSTSRLGHIRGGNRLIYKTIGGKSFKASATHGNKVYYIKRQTKVGSQTYYLLSNSPSATRGVLGWMKSSDVSTHSHVGVTKTAKRLTVKGTGQATNKAWGGSKNRVHASMSRFKGQTFDVNLTEKVGKNTWYRGKINGKGGNVWVHSSQTKKLQIKESSTSRLGHIRGGNRLIYKKLDGNSFKASATHGNKVYYIKRQAKVGSQTYYLLSNSPSATHGVLGWMKSSDVSTHSHVGVTKTAKRLTLKGTGQATNKAWGGSKDRVHASMSRFKGQAFDVNLTEKIGNNTWYRGKINGKGGNVWLHSSQTKKLQIKESSTSRLGHIRGGNRLIYKKLDGNSFKASATHGNKVYYIKRQAKVGSQTYYLLSNSPSATRGVLGWMKSSDVSTHSHVGVTKTAKRLTLKGTGQATNKAWGGSKNRVHASMSRFKGQAFDVNLTEKIGSNTWYRGKINGNGGNVWLHSSQTKKMKITEKSTSLLGHIKGGGRSIYKTIGGKSFKATANYQNKVYYIKREVKTGSETYYLLSNSPSGKNGVVGWVKSKDLSTHTHKSITKKSKKLTLKGTGKGTSKAWGGSKDTVHSSMSRFKGQNFHVNLTEKVGNNTWYRGKINGKGASVWLHSSETKNSKPLIVLDPGHGGKDPGASANGVIEKNVVLDVTKRVEKILRARGYNVIMTRRTDIFIELKERSNIANRNNANSFLSIHANSGGGIGTETWWYNRNNAVTSKRFAQSIQNGVINTTRARNRGIKNGNLSVNRESKMTSALLEIGFVDSITDARNLKKASYKNKIAQGVANGFDNYYK